MNIRYFAILCMTAMIICNASAQISWPSQNSKKKKTQSGSTTTTTNKSSGGGLLDQIGTMVGGGSSNMTQDRAASGLKEALNLGTNAASNNLGKVDGFLANAAVKILFPPEARKIENTLRSLGMGSVCDQIVTSVNRSAEAAVVEAKPIFAQAITQMTIQDAIGILTGGEGSATAYLRKTSGLALQQKFEPVIKTQLDRTQATRYWGDAIGTYNKVPMVQRMNPNLSQYVTEQAINGIFLMIAAEEKNIRANPAARIGGILQDVFGWADKNKK